MLMCSYYSVVTTHKLFTYFFCEIGIEAIFEFIKFSIQLYSKIKKKYISVHNITDVLKHRLGRFLAGKRSFACESSRTWVYIENDT